MRRSRHSQAVLGILLLLLTACRRGGSPSPSAAESVSPGPAPPPPLDTSWERVSPRLLAAGESAPDFEGIAHTGMRVRLSAFLDKPVVVFFYDSDGSAVAQPLVDELRDQWLTLLPRVSMVLGVSADDRIRHQDFATAERLPFLLVADEKSRIAQAFGVSVGAGGPRTVTFVVGKDRKILSVLPDSAPGKRIQEILAAVPEPAR